MQKQPLIVSLTSFPAAIPFAVQAIRSILAGSVLPDKVVLYLTASQFPDGKIPAELPEHPLFEVRFYGENIRSYTKLIPALKDFPDAVIITVDDDICYDGHLVEKLLRCHRRYPRAIVGHRIRRIETDGKGGLRPYCEWKSYKGLRYLLRSVRPNFHNLQTGVGGVLYPPRSLAEEMLDAAVFMDMAPTVDDVWFWAAAVAAGTPVAPVPFGTPRPHEIGKPHEIALQNTNIRSKVDVNRQVMERIFERYPLIERRFLDDI